MMHHGNYESSTGRIELDKSDSATNLFFANDNDEDADDLLDKITSKDLKQYKQEEDIHGDGYVNRSFMVDGVSEV